jgi:ABC-2 type transport system permease protein
MRTSDITAATVASIREYVRTPVLLAILLVAPAYLVGLFGYLAPDTPIQITVPGSGLVAVPLADQLVVLGVVLSSALVGGLVGLFVVQSAADADGRLTIAGFEPASLFLARVLLLCLAGTATVTVSMVVAVLLFSPENVVAMAAAAWFTAVTYGMVGVVVGSLVDKLPGVWVLIFTPLLDIVLFQNPLATETKTLATVLPAYSPMRLATDAAFGVGVQSHLATSSTMYLLVTMGVAALLYHRVT